MGSSFLRGTGISWPVFLECGSWLPLFLEDSIPKAAACCYRQPKPRFENPTESGSQLPHSTTSAASLYRTWFCLPDVSGVLSNGAVAGKLARARDIENGFAG